MRRHSRLLLRFLVFRNFNALGNAKIMSMQPIMTTRVSFQVFVWTSVPSSTFPVPVMGSKACGLGVKAIADMQTRHTKLCPARA